MKANKTTGTALAAATLIGLIVLSTPAQRSKTVDDSSGLSAAGLPNVSILVTAHPQKESATPDLGPGDFTVFENGRRQRILAVTPASKAPISLAVLIQDDLVPRVGNEINVTKQFIKSLPSGSRVMTAYITAGSLQTAQPFTTELDRAARSLRIPLGTAEAAPYNPYVEVIEALRKFDDQPATRRLILLISDGLDLSRGFRDASPWLSIDLDRAIREAQRRGLPVFAFYAPSVGLTSVNHLAVNYGQGSLNRLADETGGEAFFQGTDFVTFDPYFREFRELLDHQWLISYRSDTTEPGFRNVKPTTDYSALRLLYPVGYQPHSRSKN